MPRFLKTDYLKAGVIYFVLICAVYSPVVFFGKTLSASARFPWFQKSPPVDTYAFSKEYPNTFNVDIAHAAACEEPMDLFIGKQIRKGVFPLWNPFIGCGTVIIEQFSNRSLFPYQLLQDISPWLWRDFFLLGRLFIAAMGAFIFLRVMGSGFYPSLCAGVMYSFSGAMVVFLSFTEMSNSAMMMPYILLGPELINRYPGILSVAFSSLATSLLILAGQPEVSFYGIIFSISFFLFRIISSREEKKVFISKIIYFLLSLALSFLISLPFFLPFLVNSKEYYTLHSHGSAMGIETPTPLVNYVAAFLPEMLRWRSAALSFTSNAGWDYLGGYIGVAGVFIILASFRKEWWGRKVYLFFLSFAIIILLKNMGFPVISWIGKLPVFEQVWTPRWTGPIWNLSLAICVALGFQGIILEKEKANGGSAIPLLEKSRKWLLLILGGLLVLFLGILVNPFLFLMLNQSSKYPQGHFFAELAIIRAFLIAISAIVLFKSAKRLKLSPLFFILSLVLALCVINFQSQLRHIDLRYMEGSARNIFNIKDKLIYFSMWQGMLESVLVGLAVILALSIVLRDSSINRNRLPFIILGIIVFEMSFHVTLGYGEMGRFLSLLLHFAALSAVILYFIFNRNMIAESKVKIFISLFLISMVTMGAISSKYLPSRNREPFKNTKINFDNEGAWRIMGIKGLVYPDAAVTQEVQDIRSIVPLSIKRFQLFQDHCLSTKPQGKYKSLWFTGIIDPEGGKTISECLQKKYGYYSLAGVRNYFSPDYENIPRTQLIEDGSIKNYRNLAVMPRAFMVYNWSVAGTLEGALNWMLSHASYLDSEAVVEGTKSFPVLTMHSEPYSRVKIKEYQLHSVTIEVESDSPGLLILTDTYHPDWMVTVNGKKERILPTDLCFRGVFLDSGIYEVKFIYFPKVFYSCVAITFITLSILFILVLRNLRNKARKSREKPHHKREYDKF
jgi:hypothetical protein